jgi:hypothetical protein
VGEPGACVTVRQCVRCEPEKGTDIGEVGVLLGYVDLALFKNLTNKKF